jgi:DNA modification methylase
MQKDDTKTRVHPTQKPVELVTWFFNNWGKETITVADLFGGSGSTLIACEKTSRHCRMMELDPAYCDVIVQRWQAFTGKLATLEENKEVF